MIQQGCLSDKHHNLALKLQEQYDLVHKQMLQKKTHKNRIISSPLVNIGVNVSVMLEL